MSWLHPTLAHALHRPAPYSFWRASLQLRAGQRPLQDWLVEQANLRGFHGAYNREGPSGPLDRELTLEEIVVALCAPQAPAEGRVFKLVVRILQSGRVDARHLTWLARREMAGSVLWWLLDLVPAGERTPSLTAIVAVFGGPPRGYRGLDYDYDPQRLVRQPFKREQPWRTPHR
jgi:hypothetical protein